MTPTTYVYLDYSQSENEDSVVIGGYLPVETVYGYEPIPSALNEEQAKYILGAQANVWSEYMNNPKKVEYMIFPRLTALSEVFWSPKEKKNWNDFEQRLQLQFKRYNLWNVNYSKAYYDLKATVVPTENFDGVLWKLETKNPTAEIKTVSHFANREYELKFSEGQTYTAPILVKSTQLVAAISMVNGKAINNPVSQAITFNKATGKKITLATAPSDKYKGDGAFTLVNGVRNEKGLGRSKEFLGFSGTDCEAVIDLGKEEKFSSVTVHTFSETGSWIYPPLKVEVLVSANGQDFSRIGMTKDFIETKNGSNVLLKVEFVATSARFVKVIVKNWGNIPGGNPGEGSKAWLFVDEIEVN